MPVYVNDLKSDHNLQESLEQNLLNGKKTTVKFNDQNDYDDFISESETLGFNVGSALGFAVGGAIGAGVGSMIAGPLGAYIGLGIGNIIGGVIGGSLGKWFARFLHRLIHRILGTDFKLQIKKLWDWFGFRKYRLQLKAVPV